MLVTFILLHSTCINLYSLDYTRPCKNHCSTKCKTHDCCCHVPTRTLATVKMKQKKKPILTSVKTILNLLRSVKILFRKVIILEFLAVLFSFYKIKIEALILIFVFNGNNTAKILELWPNYGMLRYLHWYIPYNVNDLIKHKAKSVTSAPIQIK